ncbi:transporter associated domain-containing protein [Anaerolinea thermolimosa]|nr:transporter associated domain-containing protein [Anaerolinea thermolimosa]
MFAETFWLLFILLIFLDLFFAAVRGSVLNTRLPALMDMGDQYAGQVQATLALLEKPRLRTSLRMGVVTVHFALGSMAAWFILHWLQPPNFTLGILSAFLGALVLLTLEHLLEGLLLPHAELWALRLTGAARLVDWLFSPFSSILVRLLGSPIVLQQRLSPITEYELRNWVDQGTSEGSLEQGERRMIYSIFQFGETLCREIMVPRIDMLALEINTALEDALRALKDSGHSRLPVYEDTIDNIVGVLYAKDLLLVYPQEGQTLASLRDMLRPAYFVPEAKKVDELLDEMQARRIHIAIVIDEYGGVAGLVTLEDIVEEIVGEIRDEYDQGEEQLYTEIAPGEYIFNARIDLDDFNEIMGTHLDKDIADSLGGLIYGLVGRIPNGGETVEIEGLQLKVEAISGRRIRKVRARKIGTPTTPGELTDNQEGEPEGATP